ncbi:MAG: hypothetical protein Tsb002_14030 [Wenzhouxiangellaceae bacterium]
MKKLTKSIMFTFLLFTTSSYGFTDLVTARTSDILSNPEKYINNEIRAIGYLHNRSESSEILNLVLLSAEYETTLNRRYTYKFSIRIDEEFTDKELLSISNCLNHYVSVEGKLIYLNYAQSYGLEPVNSISGIEKNFNIICLARSDTPVAPH